MQIITEEKFKSCRFKPEDGLVVGLGLFDGVHRGHQAIIKMLVAQAQEHQGQAAIFTFRNHPLEVLNTAKAPPRLTSNPHKILLFTTNNIDSP